MKNFEIEDCFPISLIFVVVIICVVGMILNSCEKQARIKIEQQSEQSK